MFFEREIEIVEELQFHQMNNASLVNIIALEIMWIHLHMNTLVGSSPKSEITQDKVLHNN